jgi:hypothetical protein
MLSKYAAALALFQTAVEGLRLVVRLVNTEENVSQEDLNAARERAEAAHQEALAALDSDTED